MISQVKWKKIKGWGKESKAEYAAALSLTEARIEKNKFLKERESQEKQNFWERQSVSGAAEVNGVYCTRAAHEQSAIVQSALFNSVRVERIRGEQYSGGCTFHKYYSRPVLTINPLYTIKNIGGVVTILKKSELNSRGEKQVFWVESKGKADAVMVQGYLYKDHHSKKSCTAKIDSDRKKLAAKKLAERIVARENPDILDKTWVTMQDSLESGNCKIGTDSFLQKHFAGRAVSCKANYLLSIAGEQIQYVRRAITQAVSRQMA